MTQNVDLQVKVKFVVDPKDLQAALSGGGSGGASSAGPSSAGGGPRGRSVGQAAGLPFLSPAGPVGDRAWFAIEEERRKLLSAGNQAEKRRQGEKDKIHRDWLKTEEELRKLNLQAAQFEKRKIQDEQQMARRSQLSGRRAGKGYGSEGMFAAGTSPIMQGLAWQSLFATGDILGPMSFAPMALYQNYSLKRQRRNRGFDLGAGSDLAKAAGVGDTGQIATAGHALAALRNNAALTPAEREKRMAQVDIMSAGRVRGKIGRGIEMFEAGQVGGGAVRALGGVIGAIGGVASVATGAVAGVGAFVMAMNHLDERMKDSVNNIRSITDSMEQAKRTQRRSEQLAFEGAMAGDQGTDLSVLARGGLTATFTPQMRGGLAKIGRAAGPEKMRAIVGPMLQAARMFDVQPEDVLGEVFQSGAYRRPTAGMIASIPRLLAGSLKATPARRKEMQAMWAARGTSWSSSGTEFGDVAEKARSDVAYSEGQKIGRSMSWDATRLAEIKRLETERNKFAPGSAEYYAGQERINALDQNGKSLTRNLADNPTFLEQQDVSTKNTLAIEKLTEQLDKSYMATKALSDALTTVTDGLWESQRAARDRSARDMDEANRRMSGAGDRQ